MKSITVLQCVIRNFALFEASFEYDSVESEAGDIVVPAGKNILVSLNATIERLGLNASAPAQHSFYGWAMEFYLGRITIWVLLQGGNPWLLILEPGRSWFNSKTDKQEALKRGVEIMQQALSANDQISKIRWLTRAEYESAKDVNP